jgi:hypothetical protein
MQGASHVLVLPSFLLCIREGGINAFFFSRGCRRFIARTALNAAPSRSTACWADSSSFCRRRVDSKSTLCSCTGALGWLRSRANPEHIDACGQCRRVVGAYGDKRRWSEARRMCGTPCLPIPE